MDDIFNDTFDYSDIIPLDYKSKSALTPEFEEIYKNTENTKIDWRKRELAIKKIARICIGNQGKSDVFLQFFNNQIYPNLDVQLADLRSSLMKEACRIVSFCAKVLGLLIESSMTHMMTQHVLFKIAGNSNKVISENSSKCVLNIVNYVHSIKIITNICEQKALKANNVRVLVAQCLYIVICSYKINLIQKTIGIILETIKTLLSDPNSDVRATIRKVFIAYKKRFENEANNFFNELDKNVQKQINEDEKLILDFIEIKVNDSGSKSISIINNKNNNTVRKAFSNNIGSGSLSNSIKKNSNKNSTNNLINNNNNESITHKSSLNITPVKNIKTKNLYTSNIKQKSHEIKFPQNNLRNENISKLASNTDNKFEIKKPRSKNDINVNISNNKDDDNNNNHKDDNTEFVFTNLNLLRRAKLEHNLKNKNNQKQKIKNKPVMSKNSYQSPYKITSEISDNKNIKTKDINNKLKNTLKEKNLNELKISNSEKSTDDYKTQTEEKVLILIKKLDETKNDNDKLLVFQYLYNDFKQILKDIKYFSEVSIRKFIDKHVEYLNNEDKNITSQVIKNLMRMIYYMKDLFNKYDIETILKLMLIELKQLKHVNNNEDKNDDVVNINVDTNQEDNTLYKLIFQLYEIIIRKYEQEELLKMFFSIIKSYNELDDNSKISNELDFDTCFNWISNLIISSSDIFGNPINFKKYFKILLSSLDIKSPKILEFLDYLYKTFNENFISSFKEETEDNKKKLLSFLENNNSTYYQELLNLNKLISTRKNSEAKLNNTYNSFEDDYEELPEDIRKSIESNDVEGFKTCLEKNKKILPSFLLLLSDNEYIKYTENLINFTYALIISKSDKFISDLDKCIELFINQVIYILLTNLKNQNIIKVANDILIMTPLKLNSEKYFKTISQYLNTKSAELLLITLLHSIKNFVLDNQTKYLEKFLPYFAENLLSLINHKSKEIKEEAVHCCVEIIMVVGYKFDKYLELLPKSQQNLINLFNKKRTG